MPKKATTISAADTTASSRYQYSLRLARPLKLA